MIFVDGDNVCGDNDDEEECDIDDASDLCNDDEDSDVCNDDKVEICGNEYDNVKHKTRTINDNGYNPVWDETFNMDITNPDMALLRCVTHPTQRNKLS